MFGHDGRLLELDVVTKGRKNGFAPKKQGVEKSMTLVSRQALLQLATQTVKLEGSQRYVEHKQAAAVYHEAKQRLKAVLGGWLGNTVVDT